MLTFVVKHETEIITNKSVENFTRVRTLSGTLQASKVNLLSIFLSSGTFISIAFKEFQYLKLTKGIILISSVM